VVTTINLSLHRDLKVIHNPATVFQVSQPKGFSSCSLQKIARTVFLLITEAYFCENCDAVQGIRNLEHWDIFTTYSQDLPYLDRYGPSEQRGKTGLCCGAKGRAPFGFGQEWLSRAISSGRRLKFPLLTPNSTLRWSALAIRRLNRMEQSIARQNLETRLIAANNFFVHAFVIRLTLFLL
jgi:hypothetical protein